MYSFQNSESHHVPKSCCGGVKEIRGGKTEIASVAVAMTIGNVLRNQGK